jgi:hypothetical protein
VWGKFKTKWYLSRLPRAQPIVKTVWEPRRLATLWVSTACNGDSSYRRRTMRTGHSGNVAAIFHISSSDSDYLKSAINCRWRVGLEGTVHEHESPQRTNNSSKNLNAWWPPWTELESFLCGRPNEKLCLRNSHSWKCASMKMFVS